MSRKQSCHTCLSCLEQHHIHAWIETTITYSSGYSLCIHVLCTCYASQREPLQVRSSYNVLRHCTCSALDVDCNQAHPHTALHSLYSLTHRNPRSSDNIPLSQEMSYIGIYDYQLAMHTSHQILKAVHNDISLCECGVALYKYISAEWCINSVISVLIVCWLAISWDLCSACASSTDSEVTEHCHNSGPSYSEN